MIYIVGVILDQGYLHKNHVILHYFNSIIVNSKGIVKLNDYSDIIVHLDISNFILLLLLFVIVIATLTFLFPIDVSFGWFA